MSQVAMVSEVVSEVPALTQIVVESPCPVCGVVCPNDLYCINCGSVHDSFLMKYQTPEQLESEKQRNKLFRMAARKREKAKKKNDKQSKHHASMVRVGLEFKRQNGRAALVGDIVRRRKLDGFYDKGAFWYIRTPSGWRRSPSKNRKPTKSQINRVCQDS